MDELRELMSAKLREGGRASSSPNAGGTPTSPASVQRHYAHADSPDVVSGAHIAAISDAVQDPFDPCEIVPSSVSEAVPVGSPAVSAAATTRTSDTRDQVPRASSPTESQEPDGYYGESSTFAFVSNISSSHAPQRSRKRRRLSNAASVSSPSLDAGLTPGRDSKECYELPPKNIADGLLDAYFSHVHRLYPFVHEPTFRRDYERMWALHPRTLADQQHPLWFGLLNLVFAHGYEFCDAVPKTTVTETDSVSSLSLQFLRRARRIVFAHIFTEGSFELVQALLLMCHYLQSTLELNECWALVGLMIHTAISLGLHFNAPPSDDFTPVEREIRKRVWWGCYVIDRTLSMKLGRPPSMQGTKAFDTDMPLAVDDQYISRDYVVPRQPEGRPSLIAFFRQTIKLADIVERVLVDLYQPGRKVGPGNVAAWQNAVHSHIAGRAILLDADLLAWWEGSPAHLKEEPGVFDGPDFKLQRNVLRIRFLNLRLIIHRQSFLVFSKHEVHDPLQRAVAIASSRTCISTARATIRLIHSQYCRRLLNSLWYNLHYVFTAMGVLLSLRTLDAKKIEALGETCPDDTLELGMDFLRAASATSALAARYVSMLQRIRTRPMDVDGPATVAGQSQAASRQETADTSVSASPPPADHQDGIASWLPGPSDDLGLFEDLALVDLDDLLFGTGLPRDLLSTDWPTFGFVP